MGLIVRRAPRPGCCRLTEGWAPGGGHVGLHYLKVHLHVGGGAGWEVNWASIVRKACLAERRPFSAHGCVDDLTGHAPLGVTHQYSGSCLAGERDVVPLARAVQIQPEAPPIVACACAAAQANKGAAMCKDRPRC